MFFFQKICQGASGSSCEAVGGGTDEGAGWSTEYPPSRGSPGQQKGCHSAGETGASSGGK